MLRTDASWHTFFDLQIYHVSLRQISKQGLFRRRCLNNDTEGRFRSRCLNNDAETPQHEGHTCKMIE